MLCATGVRIVVLISANLVVGIVLVATIIGSDSPTVGEFNTSGALRIGIEGAVGSATTHHFETAQPGVRKIERETNPISEMVRILAAYPFVDHANDVAIVLLFASRSEFGSEARSSRSDLRMLCVGQRPGPLLKHRPQKRLRVAQQLRPIPAGLKFCNTPRRTSHMPRLLLAGSIFCYWCSIQCPYNCARKNGTPSQEEVKRICC